MAVAKPAAAASSSPRSTSDRERTRAARRAASRYGCASLPPPTSARAARAKAAIIRPFHAVSTLSSRCGRGRSRRARNICSRARLERRRTPRPTCASLGREVVDRPGHIEQILAGELLLRIERRIPVRLDAEPTPDERGVPARSVVDLLVRSTGRTRPRSCALRREPRSRAECCRRLRPKRSRRPRPSSRASRTEACPPPPRDRTRSPEACDASRYASTSCAWSYSIFSKCGTRQPPSTE